MSKTKKYIDIQDIPRLNNGGNGVGLPQPGAFTFNPTGVNPGSVQLNPAQTPLNFTGLIQVDQARQNRELQRERMQANLALQKQRLEAANAKEKNKIAEDMLKDYKVDFDDIYENYGLNEMYTRDAEIANRLRKTVDSYNLKRQEAVLRYKENPEMVAKTLANLNGELYNELNKDKDLRRQQQLNMHFANFQKFTNTTNARKQYSPTKLQKTNEAFLNYKNAGSEEFNDELLTNLSPYLNLSDELNTNLTNLISNSVKESDPKIKKIKDPDSGIEMAWAVTENFLPEEKINNLIDPLFNEALNNPDFAEKYAYGVDLDNPEAIKAWKDTYVNSIVGGAKREKISQSAINKANEKPGDGDSIVDYNGMSENEIVEAVGVKYNKNDDFRRVAAAGEVFKILQENPNKTKNEIFSDVKNRKRVYDAGMNAKGGSNEDGNNDGDNEGGVTKTYYLDIPGIGKTEITQSLTTTDREMGRSGAIRTSLGDEFTKSGTKIAIEDGKPYLILRQDNRKDRETLNKIGINREDIDNIPKDISGAFNRGDFTFVPLDEKTPNYTEPANGFRTDRHNNPLAITTDVAQQAKKAGANINFTEGDIFPEDEGGSRFKTARIEGDPIDAMIEVIDAVGFYKQDGGQRWQHTAMKKSDWDNLSRSEKIQVVQNMYKEEGGNGKTFQFNQTKSTTATSTPQVDWLKVSQDSLSARQNRGDI